MGNKGSARSLSAPIFNNLKAYSELQLPYGYRVQRIAAQHDCVVAIACYGHEAKCFVWFLEGLQYEVPIDAYWNKRPIILDRDTFALYSRDHIWIYWRGELHRDFAADTSGIWSDAEYIYAGGFRYTFTGAHAVERYRGSAAPDPTEDILVVYGPIGDDRLFQGEIQILVSGSKYAMDEPELVTASTSVNSLVVRRMCQFRAPTQQYSIAINETDTIYFSPAGNRIVVLY